MHSTIQFNSMVSQTERAEQENKQLRNDGLIRKTRAWHDKRQELEEQHKSCRIQYGKDLCRIQGTLQNRLYKSFRITDKVENSTARK